MRVAIVSAGGIRGYFGGRFALAASGSSSSPAASIGAREGLPQLLDPPAAPVVELAEGDVGPLVGVPGDDLPREQIGPLLSVEADRRDDLFDRQRWTAGGARSGKAEAGARTEKYRPRMGQGLSFSRRKLYSFPPCCVWESRRKRRIALQQRGTPQK